MRYTERDANYVGRDRKLWEFENRVEDKELIEIPCKVNDVIYFKTPRGIQKRVVKNIEVIISTLDENGITMTDHSLDQYGYDWSNNLKDIVEYPVMEEE